MTCPHGHRVIDSSIPDPDGPLEWTVVELEPGVYRYAYGTCDELPREQGAKQ